MREYRNLNKYVGRTFKERRLELGLTQEDLAYLVSGDRSFISDIENGKKNISLQTFANLCDVLKFDVSNACPVLEYLKAIKKGNDIYDI